MPVQALETVKSRRADIRVVFEFEKIVEQRIADAISRGELSNLPGEGKPLDLDDDAFVAPEMRLAYRILKNAGFVPEEVVVRRQIADLEQLLVDAPDETDRLQAIKRLDFLRARLAARRGFETGLQMQEGYKHKLAERFSRVRQGSDPALDTGDRRPR